MSRQEFESLPELLKRKTVMTKWSLNWKSYYKMLEADPSLTVTVPGSNEKRVIKHRLVKVLPIVNF